MCFKRELPSQKDIYFALIGNKEGSRLTRATSYSEESSVNGSFSMPKKDRYGEILDEEGGSGSTH